MRRLLTWLTPALLVAAAAHGAPACPDLTGRYRVAGSGPVFADTLGALELGGGAGGTQDLVIESTAGGRVMTLGLSPALEPGRWSSPRRTLSAGAEFDCTDGWVVMRKAVNTSRKTEATYLEGSAVVRLRPSAGGSLAVELRFRGGERSTLYAYDSARVSVPKPFTGRQLVETLSWLAASEAPAPVRPPDPAQVAAERTAEREEEALRSKLRSLIGRSLLGFVKPEPGGTRVQLRASRAEDVVDTEDRLLRSDLAYEVVREPSWYNNLHHSEIVVRPGRAGVRRPSAFRVAAELDRLMSGTAHVVKAEREGEAYVVQVALQRGAQAADVIGRVAPRSTLVAQVLPDGTVRDHASTDARVLERWRVTLRR